MLTALCRAQRRYSVVKVEHAEMYEKGRPKPGGLNDLALGTMDRTERCTTDSGNKQVPALDPGRQPRPHPAPRPPPVARPAARRRPYRGTLSDMRPCGARQSDCWLGALRDDMQKPSCLVRPQLITHQCTAWL